MTLISVGHCPEVVIASAQAAGHISSSEPRPAVDTTPRPWTSSVEDAYNSDVLAQIFEGVVTGVRESVGSFAAKCARIWEVVSSPNTGNRLAAQREIARAAILVAGFGRLI